MENLLLKISEAMKDGATPDTRREGVVACKTILAALETSPGQPMTGQGSPAASAYQPFAPNVTPTGGLVSPLDLVIAQLVSQLSSQNQNQAPASEAPKPPGLRIPFVPLANIPHKKGA